MNKHKGSTGQMYLNIQEIADILGASWNFVRENIVPVVPHVKINSRIFVQKEAFNRYLKKLEAAHDCQP